MAPEFIVPDWPAPRRIQALQTTRRGGVSPAPWHSLNLGDHVGDDDRHVQGNRARLRDCLPAEPVWLQQVHGSMVLMLPPAGGNRIADAACTREAGQVCVVMTADCLPILLCDRAGTVVAAAHAGWRGLCDGVVEATLAAMAVPGTDVMAWLGPAIGPAAFEVGPEVRQAFVGQDDRAAAAFVAGRDDRYLADIYLLARQRLARLGVADVYGGGHCTVAEAEDFFSYRRDRQTGRMASLIWID